MSLLPDTIILDKRLSDRAVRLYALFSFLSGEPTSRADLGGLLNCSADSIDRAVRELKQIGAVTVTTNVAPDGGLAASSYQVQR